LSETLHFTISDLLHSFLIHVTFRHFSRPVYDSNFYTMKFSMFTAFAAARVAASFFILQHVQPSVNNFFACFLKFFHGI